MGISSIETVNQISSELEAEAKAQNSETVRFNAKSNKGDIITLEIKYPKNNGMSLVEFLADLGNPDMKTELVTQLVLRGDESALDFLESTGFPHMERYRK